MKIDRDIDNASWLRAIILGIGAFLALVAVAVWATICVLDYWTADKRDYSTLYRIESQHNADTAVGPVFLNNFENSGVDALGLPTGKTSTPRVWFIANRLSTGGGILFYPRMDHYHVRCEDLHQLIQQQKLHRKLSEYLLYRCGK